MKIDPISFSETILRLEVNKGHLKWSISDVARFSKISRPLIYYHFGNDKKELLTGAWNNMLKTIFALEESQKLGVKKRISLVVERINKSPYLFVLFFLEKRSNSEIGSLIRDHEQHLFEVLKSHYPHMHKDDILKTYLMQLGVVAYRPQDFNEVEFFFPK